MDHTHLAYVTFNRAAADEGKERMQQALQSVGDNCRGLQCTVEATTIHAWALSLLGSSGINSQRLNLSLSDQSLKDQIGKLFRTDIDNHLRHAEAELRSTMVQNHREGEWLDRKKERLRHKTTMLIFKVLESFCRSNMSEEDFQHCKSEKVKWSLLNSGNFVVLRHKRSNSFA